MLSNKEITVTWLIDLNTQSLISKRCLLSGIRFNDRGYNGDFEST